MRRFFVFILALGLLALPVRGVPVRYVALTFDDGPSGRFTRELLDGLQQRGARATFFLCGYRIKEYPEEARRIYEEGHEIGYHGYSHKNMRDMSRRAIAQELIDTRALLPEDCEPVLFRPPGGFVTDGVRQVAEVRQLTLLRWSVDPRDWAVSSTAAIEASVLKHVKDGDVILLHDMTATSVRAALDIVDTLQQQGFRFVTVSELAQLREIRLKPGKTYTDFPAEQ